VSAAMVLAQATFDVASIKPSDPASHGMSVGISPSGSFRASGVTLMTLIQQAYDVRGFQVSGGPGWISTDRYDIVTKNESAGPTQQDLIKMNDAQRDEFRTAMMTRLRALIEDRFQVKIHRETKEMQVYGLVVAKGGPKLQPKEPGGRDSSLSVSRGDEAIMHVTAKGLPIPNLVKYLSDQSGRQVIDETGQIHLLHGAEMNSARLQPGSWMPADYARRLAPNQIDDIVAFLSRQAVRAEAEADRRSPRPAQREQN